MSIAQVKNSEQAPLAEAKRTPPGMYGLFGREENIAGVLMVPVFAFIDGELMRGMYFRSYKNLEHLRSDRRVLIRALTIKYGKGFTDPAGVLRWKTDRTGIVIPPERSSYGEHQLFVVYESLNPEHQQSLLKATAGGL